MTQCTTNQTVRGKAHAFTLIELLVVIGILGLLMALAVPSVKTMMNSTRFQNGIASVPAAVSAARTVATLPRSFNTGEYAGAAVLFTPSGELRIVQSYELIKNASGGNLEESGKHGYTDSQASTSRLPQGIRAVAVIRNFMSGKLELITAPFAIRFDRHGSLIAGLEGKRLVYYDGKKRGKVTVSRKRLNGYNPDDYDSEAPNWTLIEMEKNYGNWKVATEKDGEELLPFDQLETTIAVIIFDVNELRNEKGNEALKANGQAVSSDVTEWIFDNGEVLLFNRYSGTRVK